MAIEFDETLVNASLMGKFQICWRCNSEIENDNCCTDVCWSCDKADDKSVLIHKKICIDCNFCLKCTKPYTADGQCETCGGTPSKLDTIFRQSDPARCSDCGWPYRIIPVCPDCHDKSTSLKEIVSQL